jgi:hypothetical protein
MALHLLIFGVEDESLLLQYVVRPPVYICGIDTDPTGEPVHRLSIDEVLELRYADALTYGIVHPELGKVTSTRLSSRTLSWKTEVLGHREFVERNRDNDIIDFYLSPMLLYRRPHWVGDVMSETQIEAAGSEAYPAVNAWYRKIYSWCRSRATNVFSWDRDLYPGQFVSETVNTRWAFPAALEALEAGRRFCFRGLTEEGIRVVEERRRRRSNK